MIASHCSFVFCFCILLVFTATPTEITAFNRTVRKDSREKLGTASKIPDSNYTISQKKAGSFVLRPLYENHAKNYGPSSSFSNLPRLLGLPYRTRIPTLLEGRLDTLSPRYGYNYRIQTETDNSGQTGGLDSPSEAVLQNGDSKPSQIGFNSGFEDLSIPDFGKAGSQNSPPGDGGGNKGFSPYSPSKRGAIRKKKVDYEKSSENNRYEDLSYDNSFNNLPDAQPDVPSSTSPKENTKTTVTDNEPSSSDGSLNSGSRDISSQNSGSNPIAPMPPKPPGNNNTTPPNNSHSPSPPSPPAPPNPPPPNNPKPQKPQIRPPPPPQPQKPHIPNHSRTIVKPNNTIINRGGFGPHPQYGHPWPPWNNETPKGEPPKFPEDPGSHTDFLNVPRTGNGQWQSRTLTDIMNHSKERRHYGGGPGTDAHENLHGIDFDLTNKNPEWKWKNGMGTNKNWVLYVGNDKAIKLTEPENLSLLSVAEYVPYGLRGMRFKLYFVDQSRYFNDRPFYVLEELNAYIAGAKTNVETAEAGKWNYPWREDGVRGALEFSVYALALGLAVRNRSPSCFGSNTQFREALAYLVKDAMSVFQRGRNLPQFKGFGMGEYLEKLKTGDEAKHLRKFATETFGEEWTKEVLEF